MKKYIPQAKKEDHIISTRYIKEKEYNSFHKNMEKFKKYSKIKQNQSKKSALEVRVR